MINISVISAATTTCEYDKIGLTVTFDDSGKSTINQNFYPETKTPWYINWLVNYSSGGIDSTDNLKTQDYELLGSCPEKIYTCKYEEYSLNSGLKNFFYGDAGRFLHLRKVYLYYSENDMKDSNPELDKVPNDGEWDVTSEWIVDSIEAFEFCAGEWDAWILDEAVGGVCVVGRLAENALESVWDVEDLAIKRKECFDAEYTGDGPTYNLACPNLSIYIGRFTNAINEYKDCKKNDASCISKTITNVNEKEDMIKNYCKSIMQEQDYDGGTEQDCLEACMGVKQQIIKAKKSAGILGEGSGECGFSERLVTWMLNIFRWVKYILPVIVIVLGILDFIKAIGSDKDDEMKKAQKRFITRLIAAALVFIIPLIIEFVLVKMGFGYDTCSLF